MLANMDSGNKAFFVMSALRAVHWVHWMFWVEKEQKFAETLFGIKSVQVQQ